jgi:hypothetical protein
LVQGYLQTGDSTKRNEDTTQTGMHTRLSCKIDCSGQIIAPAPRQKLPEISPIFTAGTVRLHVSRRSTAFLASYINCPKTTFVQAAPGGGSRSQKL